MLIKKKWEPLEDDVDSKSPIADVPPAAADSGGIGKVRDDADANGPGTDVPCAPPDSGGIGKVRDDSLVDSFLISQASTSEWPSSISGSDSEEENLAFTLFLKRNTIMHYFLVLECYHHHHQMTHDLERLWNPYGNFISNSA